MKTDICIQLFDASLNIDVCCYFMATHSIVFLKKHFTMVCATCILS